MTRAGARAGALVLLLGGCRHAEATAEIDAGATAGSATAIERPPASSDDAEAGASAGADASAGASAGAGASAEIGRAHV